MRLAFVVPGILAVGCQVPVTLDFPVGPLTYSVSTQDLNIPPEMRDGAALVSVPCQDECPGLGESPLQMSCEEQVCNPQPFSYALDLPPVELGDFEDLSKLGNHITEARIRRVLYQVEENTLNVELPAIEVFWGPETAAYIDDPSVHRLGTIPAVAAGSAPTGEVPLAEDGAGELGQHFVRSSTSFRMFAETAVDLEPGQPLPAGTLEFTATVEVHLEGEGSL